MRECMLVSFSVFDTRLELHWRMEKRPGTPPSYRAPDNMRRDFDVRPPHWKSLSDVRFLPMLSFGVHKHPRLKKQPTLHSAATLCVGRSRTSPVDWVFPSSGC